VGSMENNAILIGHIKNRIDVTIEEQFPGPEKEEQYSQELTVLPSEPDTVIISKNGTWVKIQGDSFFPLKISDYNFEIKKLFSTDDFVNNNVSTNTSDHQVIKNASAIRILAIPKNTSSSIPVKFQKPAIIMIPVEDSLTSKRLTIFYQAKDSKSFITWKITRDSTLLKHYAGNNFFMINVTQLGWVMVGVVMTTCNCRITTPQFQEQQLKVVYPDLGSVVFFEHSREKFFNIPCASGGRGLQISTKAFDQSGRMFSLEKTFLSSVIKKDKFGIYKIRKSDYVRL
jgi:hypothetical protein